MAASIRKPMEGRNIRLDLEFDGADFCGWQVQDNGRTVQGEMERAIRQVTGETVRVTGCSRTDAGVHARHYVMNFRSATTIPPERLMHPLNNALPPDIRVRASRQVPDAFHARRDATSKTYVYQFLNEDVEPAIGRSYLALERGPLDEDAMRNAARLFLGRHDFRAFRSTGSSVRSTVRTIFAIDLVRAGSLYRLTVTGDGFLYNMVRIIAGTLFYVGHGTRSLQDVRDALADGDRLRAGKVAPARGLCLESVHYDGDQTAEEVRPWTPSAIG